MDNTRISRINRLLQKELGELFRIQTSAIKGTLISVTSVSVSPDLGIARVRLSIFPSDRTDELLKNIKDNTHKIRFDLGSRIGKQIRKIPELSFFIDDSLEYIERIDKLLGK